MKNRGTLSPLYKGLKQVMRFRRTVRVGSAASMFLAAPLWGLLAAMLLDVTMDMGRLERGVTFVILVGVVIWSFRRFMRPVLGQAEGELETAMMVEGKHELSTDLVAAMQFSEPERPQFGSDELRTATVDRAVGLASSLNYLAGFSRRELHRRVLVFAASGLVFAATMVSFPGHASAFMNRLFLGNAHYPTRTVIEAVKSPGDVAAFSLPVSFRVRAGGELPKRGLVKLRTVSSGLLAEVELLPEKDDPTLYAGLLPRASDDFSFRVFLGDAHTDPRAVRLIPLAVVKVDFDIETPDYAASGFAATPKRRGSWVALEGSRVVPIVTASNKTLRSAQFTMNELDYPMEGDGERFILRGDGSPLNKVATTVRWEVQVTDGDGLNLERPVSGVLQVRADQPPNIAIATATRLVWPEANPKIRYKALDDYALDKVAVTMSVQRLGEGSADAQPETTFDIATATNHNREIEGTFSLDVNALKVAKGDRLYISFEAFDYRGAFPGLSMRSEPMVLEVLDREGILEALRELDEEVERKLDQIIDAQLGI
jgi:hypothetical protein